MADFSLTTVVVVPVGQATPIAAGSTQDLTPGAVGFYDNAYVATATPGSGPYFYVAQGRDNTYLQGTKRSDKISGAGSTGGQNKVTEWYKVSGCPTPTNQILELSAWSVQCDDIVTVTLRAHSSYLDTLYFNGWTRSVTVNAPCCNCGADPCIDVDIPTFIDSVITALNDQGTAGTNPDNITFADYYSFERIGADSTAKLVITGKALTAYGVPCDVSAFPHEYDRLNFDAWVIEGPATTSDFIVDDTCDVIATSTTTQSSNYATGTSDEIYQLELNYHSYQAGYLKHLYRTSGYNGNFESQVTAGTTYDTYYVKFNDIDNASGNWGDYVPADSMVIVAVDTTDSAAYEAALVDALGAVVDDGVCLTTTSTTTV